MLREPGARTSGRRLVVSAVGQFALAGIVALAIVGVATSIASRRIGEREAITEARTTTVIQAQGVVRPAITDALLAGDPMAVVALDEVVRRDVLDEDLVRLKLWDQDSRIVYSDEPALVGTQWELEPEQRSSFVTGRIEAEVSDLTGPENRFERQYGKLLEVYLPVVAPGGEVLLLEAYYRYDLVTTNGDRLWRSFAPIALGALVLLEVVQLPLAWSLARRLRHRLQEREALLRRAVEASDIERRQIAGDLHDGVVQDLSGVALALSAAGRRARDPAADAAVLGEAADAVRGSIRSLRSLLVDIYPPDLTEVSLPSALADLLERARAAGLDTELDADGLAQPVPDPVARLLYRAAQEGVRNAVSHAGASRIVLRAASDGASAAVEVVDDGVGVDAAALEASRASGHLGLTALRGVVADAGGTLELGPAEGGGTTLRVAVPLA